MVVFCTDSIVLSIHPSIYRNTLSKICINHPSGEHEHEHEQQCAWKSVAETATNTRHIAKAHHITVQHNTYEYVLLVQIQCNIQCTIHSI